ncbi:hypothetical protein NQ176_g2005 [Zarea fungicola]|uniref:Uncharacterized protein n=1 Tax=Zarea fungicola TaxID=93591 RepID=A0ACC1NSZ9_9HYPO|nr:hypothetical protein NQ176_g2005 [Lecanicillium fungicola]
MHTKAILSFGLLPTLLAAQKLNNRGVSCAFSVAAGTGETCDSFCQSWSVSIDDFKALNPGVQCPSLVANNDYCVDGTVTTDVPTTTPATTMTTTTSTKTTTSSPGGPSPTQSGLAANCDKFHLVSSGDQCGIIESKYGISAAQFSSWNPAINARQWFPLEPLCSNLIVGYYVCVNVPGATSTQPSNGIQTPQPTQPGMVGNCNQFHHIFPGNTCDQITSYHHISQQDFAKWNPQVGPQCTGLVADANACVGVLPDSTPTSPSNGIETPQPTQPGMVGNCNQFHHIFPGNTCDQITSYHHISQQDFAKWNPQVGPQCTGLVADANACVGVLPDSTPTSPSNGIETPQPTQPGMVGNCNQFHHIFPGNTCDQITSYHHISQQDFAKWNPQVGAQCTGLIADANACVGVIS